MASFASIRTEWWQGWARAFPEDATSLGLRGHGHRLRDDEGPAGEAELAFHRSVLPKLEALEEQATDVDQLLDIDAMQRVSRFRAHVLGTLDHDRRSLELSLYPHAMIVHQLAHARSAGDLGEIEERLSRVPRVLAARETALVDGRARGHRADRDTLAMVTGFALHGAERWYREIDVTLTARSLTPTAGFITGARAAADATRAHRTFLERELSATAGDTARLERADYTLRLSSFYGEPIDPDELVTVARDEIARLGPKLVEHASEAARPRGARITTVEDALAFVGWLFGEHPVTSAEIVRGYKAAITRARQYVVDHDLFNMPKAQIAIAPIPAGMVHGASATNWPAPLADRTRQGHLALSLDPSAHSMAFFQNLAVHEAIPGHFLQSAAWQEAFGEDLAPVRFAAVNDDVAAASSYFGAMPNIEGYAVHCEELLLDRGFYEGAEAVAAVASGILRAARVVADVSIHTRTVDRPTALAELIRSTGMPKRWCETQLLRFCRIPGQATAYFLGAKKIRALFDRAARHEGFDASRFHDALFALGPATPASMEPLL